MVALSDVAAYPTAKTEPSDETATVTGAPAVAAACPEVKIFSQGLPVQWEETPFASPPQVVLSNLAKAN